MPEPQTLLLDSAFETYDGRRESAKTLLGFSLVYLTGYFTDPPASFHPELIHALESDDCIEHDVRFDGERPVRHSLPFTLTTQRFAG